MEYGKAMIIRLVTEAENKHFSQEEGFSDEKVYLIEEALEVGLAVVARSAARFCLKGLVQNCLQVNLQVSMQAISKASMPDHFDFFNGLNLGVTMFAVFLDIPDMISIFYFIWWLQDQVNHHVSADETEFTRVQG